MAGGGGARGEWGGEAGDVQPQLALEQASGIGGGDDGCGECEVGDLAEVSDLVSTHLFC